MLQNVNKTVGVMSDSILNMNHSLKQLHPSNTDDQLDPKWIKYSSKDEMSACDGSDEDGDDFRPFVALKLTKPGCWKLEIFSMQTNQVWLLRNNWLSLLTTCG